MIKIGTRMVCKVLGTSIARRGEVAQLDRSSGRERAIVRLDNGKTAWTWTDEIGHDRAFSTED